MTEILTTPFLSPEDVDSSSGCIRAAAEREVQPAYQDIQLFFTGCREAGAEASAAHTIMITSEGDSGTGPTTRGRTIRRTWGAATIVSGELAPEALQDFGEATVPSLTLLLCTGAVSVGADSARPVADPIVFLRPGGAVTLHAHTTTGVMAVTVPATDEASSGEDPSREESEPHQDAETAPWRLIQVGAYLDGLRALLATLLEDETAQDDTSAGLVARILTQAVQGVAVRY